MSINQDFESKMNRAFLSSNALSKSTGTSVFKFLGLFIILVVGLFSFHANAADCLTFSDAYLDSGTGLNVYRFYDYSNPVDDCLDSVVLTSAEYAVLMAEVEKFNAIEEISTLTITSAFTFGFGTYLLFWAIGFKMRMAKEVVRLV